jgi:unspecific monooxygenase
VADTQLFTAPRPAPPAGSLSSWQQIAAFRRNVLGIWPAEAYERDHLVQPFLGTRRLLISAPDAIQHVLVNNAENYRRTAAAIRILRPIVGDGLLLSTGETWRHQRRTAAPAMAPRSLSLLLRPIPHAVDEAVVTLRDAAGTVDLLALMQRVTLDIAGRSMFSLEMGQFGAEMRAQMAEYARRFGRPYLLDLLLPVGIPSWHDFGRRRFQRGWTALIDAIIAARLAQPEADAPRDLFDLLRAARDPQTGEAFSPVQLRDQVATMITAGHETTALTLFWCFYLLANAPDIQQRVAAEARDVELGPDALARLPYTHAVVQEALRLYPPAFVLVRQAIAADSFHGIDIPAGGVVMISPWVLHHHRALWRDADAFDPSRFLPGAPPPARFSYLPFGAGPRVCIGAQFALAEATHVLAGIIRAFRVRTDDTVLPVCVVTTQPDHPVLFSLERR